MCLHLLHNPAGFSGDNSGNPGTRFHAFSARFYSNKPHLHINHIYSLVFIPKFKIRGEREREELRGAHHQLINGLVSNVRRWTPATQRREGAVCDGAGRVAPVGDDPHTAWS
ncbi:hypothetical protein Hdeb2414_s0020g00552401 [Helianthus debilis subsp. tardiflorus]